MSSDEENHHVDMIGKTVCKEFPKFGWFEGTIKSLRKEDDEVIYFVEYEDGDSEELELPQVLQCIATPKTLELVKARREGITSPPPTKKAKTSEKKLSKKKKETKEKKSKKSTEPPPKKKPRAGTLDVFLVVPPTQTAEMEVGRSGRARKKVVYTLDSEDEDLSEAEVKPRRNAQKNSKKSKRKAKQDDDDDSVASMDEEDSDSEEELVADIVESDEDDDESVEIAPKSKKRKSASQKPAKASKKTAPAETGKKKMADSFEPINFPYFKDKPLEWIEENKQYLDPCGMEATDDIIDRLVGEQVDKIGSLLQGALSSGAIGSSDLPLQLGTACSGTDAPSLALTIVKEQMEQRGYKQVLDFDHTFSCEVDPFKQGYLARNFDSVLYPDIVKLCEDKPRDVFGQEQEIPPFNFFVAGTSCKNFSMLRSNKRIDIEDKGCSGETFLGATEFLFKEKPNMTLFENVINAPWLKMQEYITGRVKLSECDSSKAISGGKKGKNDDLIFAKDENDNIVVDAVPAVYGVRCGAVVSGFLRPDSTELNPVHWPSGAKKTCRLSELIAANKISKKDDILVFETDCVYCTHIVKVDTKEYGLPQTRLRTYMLVWRPEDDNINDDLGEYWEKLVQHLRSPVRHSLQSFILQVDHDIIRVFREALKGPPGRETVRDVCLEPDFWKSANANLPHNKNTRKKLGVEDKARFITSWQEFGKKQVPPHYWLEYMKCNKARQTDLLDILHASAMRDAECHDSNFSSFYWNISQNASKEKHRSACPGIAGCITPGGDFFLPQEGRPILGCEKLMIQGIPYFRLALGNETEVQLGDLAGNAMSLTVVCATMLSAITCKELRRLTMASSHGDVGKILSQLPSPKKSLAPAENSGSNGQLSRFSSVGSGEALQFFRKLASLAPAAVKSSILCTCETSGNETLTCKFLQCRVCRVSCCRNCICTTAGYNIESHDTEEVYVSSEDHSLGNFQSVLREIVPPSLVFSEDGIEEVAGIGDDEHRVAGLAGYIFSLNRIKRDRRKWHIIYRAGENHGVGEALAEFRITVGELFTEDSVNREVSEIQLGVMGALTSYIPAKVAPLRYGLLEPCVVLTVRHGSNDMSWKVKCQDGEALLCLEGRDTTDSFRKEVGLTQDAADALLAASRKPHNTKHYAAAKKRGEEKRWLYPENWQVWPESIHLKAPPSSKLSTSVEDALKNAYGTYKRAKCRQTMNQSALWVKERRLGEDAVSMYIMIRPTISRTGPDRAVVTTSISHGDHSSVIAVLPPFWQPCDALVPELHIVEDVSIKQWKTLTKMNCIIPSSEIKVGSGKDSPNVLASVSGLNSTEVTMLCRGNTCLEELVELNVASGQKAQQTMRLFNSICATSVLKYISSSEFRYNLTPAAEWNEISPSDPTTPFGCCKRTIPPRPSEEWFFDTERNAWDRRSEAGASRSYYLALQAAPKPFELWVDKRKGSLAIKYFPQVVGHRAAFQLCEGRGGQNLNEEVSVSYRLTDVTLQRDPVISPFKVSNCESEKPTTVPLAKPFELYERQQKVVTKMLAIEASSTEFEELELSEQDLPGSGISLLAKASRKRAIRGGVIADAIGSGKTVISIAMILQGLEKARNAREMPKRSGATLVVVPPALIDQWSSEIKRFSPVSLRIIKLYDFNALKANTLKQIIEADVVICPIDILESKGYLENLVKEGRLKDVKEIPKLPSDSGQTEVSGVLGTYIPASSADPYAGGNNSNNQKRRNQSAYYTFVYQRAIQNIRERDLQPPAKGVPLEYFEWERVIVDEIHESLCTTKNEMKTAAAKDKAANGGDKTSAGFFREKNRRAGREFLGITEKDTTRRPLVFRRAIYGLTGTPLLDTSSRVIELANLMGNTYISGLSSHWRKLERESCRDIFLQNYLEPKQSREVRSNTHRKCQDYLQAACCRNKTGEEMDGIELITFQSQVQMTSDEKTSYLKSQHGIPPAKQSFAIQPTDFDVTAGHDISKFLRQNASMPSRCAELVRICKEILEEENRTKIIVFVDGRIQAGEAACTSLVDSGLGCTWLKADDSVEEKNRKIGWYQTGDATAEDRARPRVLVLNFEHAAGLNLQTECHHLVLFSPLYIGDGGTSGDSVADASTELQAIGRVYRPGQSSPKVHVYRIEMQGPNGEDALDAQLIRRNTDEATIAMAVNAGE